MKASFNVLDEPWIPVIALDGKEKLLGIRQTLSEAHTLREISSASPLEEYAVYRFLGLFLMDALRPERESTIKRLLKTGRFESKTIEDYISVCENEGVSFNLFDEARPFLQSPFNANVDNNLDSIGKLDLTKASGTNHTHFDHGAERNRCLQPDEALRQLLTMFTFALSGGRGYQPGINGVPPYYSIITGENLYETLVYTLLPIDRISISLDDPPALWRNQAPIIQNEELATVSWMQGMLLPARRIVLVPNAEGKVTGVYFSPGEHYANNKIWHDPYVLYSSKTNKPIKPDGNRAIWENLYEIIRPESMQSLLRLYRDIHRKDTLEMTVYGVETDNKAKCFQVYRYSLRIPTKLLDENNPAYEVFLGKAISAIDQIEDAMRTAFIKVCHPETPEMKENTHREKKKVSQTYLNYIGQYLRECEPRFWFYCDELCTKGADVEIYRGFVNDVARFAKESFDAAITEANFHSHRLAIAESARNKLLMRIARIKKEANL